MAEVTIRLRHNPRTGEREVVIHYESESEALPSSVSKRYAFSTRTQTRPHPAVVRESIERRYGAGAADRIKRVETFELCEYGRQPSLDELSAIFPK